MLGAIAGDVIGSVYERHNHRSMDFPLFQPQSIFTDNTVLSVAFADAILHGGDYTTMLKEFNFKIAVSAPNLKHREAFGVYSNIPSSLVKLCMFVRGSFYRVLMLILRSSRNSDCASEL